MQGIAKGVESEEQVAALANLIRGLAAAHPGSVMTALHVVMGRLAVLSGVPAEIAFGLGLLCGTMCGLVNGLLVTKLKLPPFIVTLGMLNVAFALTHIYSEEQTVTNLPGPLTALGQTFPLGKTDITYGSLVTIVLFLLLAYALSSTGWGRHVYALGNSPEAARLNGIRTSMVSPGCQVRLTVR